MSRIDSIFDAVQMELGRACHKFPSWPTDPMHAANIVTEESGELAKAVNERVYEPEKSTFEDVRAEALQTAAMAVRFLLALEDDAYVWQRAEQYRQDLGPKGEWPQPGDLVRYGSGSTALAVLAKPHAGGWHGHQCMGGSTYIDSREIRRPSGIDMATWLDNGRWRPKSRTQAADARIAREFEDLTRGP